MMGWAVDDMSSLHLALYADADFAGCVESLRSTSVPSLIFKELIFACPLPVQVSDKEV